MNNVDWQAILDNVPEGAEDWTHYNLFQAQYVRIDQYDNGMFYGYCWSSKNAWTRTTTCAVLMPRIEAEKNALLQNSEKAHKEIGNAEKAWGSAIASVANKSKYHREIKPGVWVDVYDVLDAFDPDNRNAADDHAIKKMLLPGKRGHKDGIKDRSEAIQSLQRSIQKIEEKQHEQAK